MIAFLTLLRPFLPWIIGGAVALAVTVWFGAHERGVQKEKDEKVIAALRVELDTSHAAERQREAETAACVDATKVQSAAVLDAEKRAKAAQDAAAAMIAKARAESAASTRRVAELQARAGAAPLAQTCEATLKAADAIVDESIRTRRK